MLLWKKMLREILQNKGSYAACLVLVFLSLVVYTSFSILNENLYMSQEIFYEEQRFADGFVELESMPRAQVSLAEELEGVERAAGRLVEDVRLYRPEGEENVYLRLVSLDFNDSRRLNDVHLIEDGELVPGQGHAWIESQFYDANQLQIGETLEVITHGRLREIQVAGKGMSPEFTYPLRDQRELYPNPRQFGVAFVPYEDMEKFFPDRRGEVNSVVFTLEEGADYDRVEQELENVLEPYGIRSIYPRADQVSHMILEMEIEQLQNMARAMPMMFLFIGGIILYIMLKRMVEQQRTQIGIMKAFGYSQREILFHYLSYGLFVGFTGGLIGGLLGLYLAGPLTSLLLEFFALPMVFTGFSWLHLLTGILLSLGVFLFAGYHGCKQVLRLKPAEAMRPPAPAFSQKILLERISFFWQMLTTQGMMAARNLSRSKSRTLFIFLGISLSCAVVAITWSFNDMIDKLVFYQFDEVEIYDARATLSQPMRRQPVQEELQQHDEVQVIEPMIEIPARFSSLWHEQGTQLLGIPDAAGLYRILDDRGNRIPPSPDGLILSGRLAGKLEVGPGDRVEIESPFIRDNDQKVLIPVVEVIPQYLGMNAYMELSALEEILGQGQFATHFMFNVPGEGKDAEEQISSIRDRYRESDWLVGIDGSEERIRQTRELMETFGVVVYMYVLIGVVMGFSIIYSSSFIILSERSREMASMMVLGMSAREVFSVITFEQWFISIFGIIAGLPLAQFMQRQMAEYMSTDLFVVPDEISTGAIVAAPVISILSIWIAQRFVLRRIERLSLIEVLKSRE